MLLLLSFVIWDQIVVLEDKGAIVDVIVIGRVDGACF